MYAHKINCISVQVDELKLEETMKCTGQELFNALTQRDMIQVSNDYL